MQDLYQNLPVYKKIQDLTIHLENVVKNFNRHHRYCIGTELRNLSMRILILVAKANSKKDRSDCLKEAINLLEELKIVIRVCREIKCFKSFRSFEYASKLVVDLLKQCEGWLKKSQNSTAITA